MSQKFCESHLFAFLRRFDQAPRPLDMALSDYLKTHKSIGAHDRRFLGDTVYSLIRWKALLDYLLGNQSTWEEKLKTLNSIDLNNPPQHLPLWVRSGSSQYIFNELSKRFEEKAVFEICRILNQSAPLTVRVNLLKTTRESLLTKWQSLFDVEPCLRSPAGIRFKKRTPLTSLPEFKEGLFEIQDEGSQLVADLIKAQKGEQVLDYCSGSGGKSLAIAANTMGRGQIYLHDIRPQILLEARRRFRRAGAQNAQFLPPDHPRLETLKNKMDWVLADVPCSGSGTYRRNPDMKWKIDEQMLERLVKEQREIFSSALTFMKPNGKIVYATCSLFERENEGQVEYFLKNYPLDVVGAPLSILPESGGPDGFFGVVFCKKS